MAHAAMEKARQDWRAAMFPEPGQRGALVTNDYAVGDVGRVVYARSPHFSLSIAALVDVARYLFAANYSGQHPLPLRVGHHVIALTMERIGGWHEGRFTQVTLLETIIAAPVPLRRGLEMLVYWSRRDAAELRGAADAEDSEAVRWPVLRGADYRAILPELYANARPALSEADIAKVPGDGGDGGTVT